LAPGDSRHPLHALMTDMPYRHLPVVRPRKVVGMLSIGDLSRPSSMAGRGSSEQLQR
jgi:CBS domain-containing protein